MKWIDTVLVWLFPKMLLEGTNWESLWRQRERNSFSRIARLFFLGVGIGYICHFYFYDKPLGLEPESRWLIFRYSIAFLCLGCFGFYCTRISRTTTFYRVPAIIVCTILSVSQAFVALWDGAEAWVFCFLFIIASVMLLRFSALASMVFATANIIIISPILYEAGVSPTNIISGSIVCLGMVAVIRSSYLAEIQNFILNQENVSNQQKLLELNDEFMERLKSFIPRVIASRLERSIEENGQSVLEASVDLLNARPRDVACLFSDIRGFTQGSKDLEHFVTRSVIPEVKVCTDAIENFDGIPRKIGDLIFAYFDDESIRLNLFRAIAAGLEIARSNADINATSAERDIRRYILISCGKAVVGNLGGLNSSIEITALGSPVNLLSRIDEITKNPKIARHLEAGDLVLCNKSKHLLVETLENSPFKVDLITLELDSLGVQIRDFPDEVRLYVMRPTNMNHRAIMEPYEYIREQLNESRGQKHVLVSQS